jgi:methionine synthase I (cobalamin-dependent)
MKNINTVHTHNTLKIDKQIDEYYTEYFILTHCCGTKQYHIERLDRSTPYTEALLYDPRELECPLVAG